MKKIKLITAIIIICSSSLFASKSFIFDLEKDDVKEHLNEVYETSKFLVEKGMVLNILFSFDSEGELEVFKVPNKKKEFKKIETEDLNQRKTLKIYK